MAFEYLGQLEGAEDEGQDPGPCLSLKSTEEVASHTAEVFQHLVDWTQKGFLLKLYLPSGSTLGKITLYNFFINLFPE